ncbi:hypothetical protein HZB07_06805 [Candidatus Saganbacteria bacterium]|nr:hypothetical protein [Candidatus Saganbacteria bacterium]
MRKLFNKIITPLFDICHLSRLHYLIIVAGSRKAGTFVICVICSALSGSFVLCSLSSAEMRSADGTYRIPFLSITGGGHNNLTAPGYNMIDLKGQGVIGRSTATGYEVGLGGIYGWGAVVPALPETVPAGTVPLTISREANNIKITWDYIRYPQPQIFVLTGDGSGQYTDNTTRWVKVLNNGLVSDWGAFVSASDTLFHYNQVGRGSGEVYYKGLQVSIEPAGRAVAGGPTYLASARAVGKVNVNIGSSYTLLSMPFIPQSGDHRTWLVQDIFGSQINAGEIQYNQNGLVRQVCSSRTWPRIEMGSAKGFWIRSSNPVTCTLIGGVLGEVYTRTIISGYDLYGYPHPTQLRIIAREAQSLGIAPVNDDEVQLISGGGLVRHVFSSGWDASFTVDAARGYWYRNLLSTPRVFTVII